MPAVNTGYVIYTLLVQYSSLTGQPTGLQKPNVPGDPDYVAPVYNATECPPGEPAPTTQSIIVEIDAIFALTISLLWGASSVTRTTSGTWVVPERIYDAATFNFTTAPQPWICKVTYNNGTSVKMANASGTIHIMIPGPFAKITKIQILPDGGDFNDDFNDDFNA